MSTNRPPSCDLLPEFYQPELKPCPFCGAGAELYDYNTVVICTSWGCKVVGPDNDPDGHKWNSIPRRSDVMELLRLVETTERDLRLSKLYERFKSVAVFANKLIKEMGD